MRATIRFSDGNKRTALVASELLLTLKGYALEATDADCLLTFVALAEGSITEGELIEWFRDNAAPTLA